VKNFKKINNIKSSSHKYIRNVGIIQENLSMNVALMPTEQVSNRKTWNNRNRNNQTAASVPTEQVSAERFHYLDLTPKQMAALYQERLAQYLDGDLNGWGIMTSNDSK
jgi:hypothetical protein